VVELPLTAAKPSPQMLTLQTPSPSSLNLNPIDEAITSNSSFLTNKKNPIAVSDKIIEQIVLMSDERPDFRAHICTQLLLEKKKTENIIKEHQERYNQCDRMIRCFQNGSRLTFLFFSAIGGLFVFDVTRQGVCKLGEFHKSRHQTIVRKS
jgi:hypothetical protein